MLFFSRNPKRSQENEAVDGSVPILRYLSLLLDFSPFTSFSELTVVIEQQITPARVYVPCDLYVFYLHSTKKQGGQNMLRSDSRHRATLHNNDHATQHSKDLHTEYYDKSGTRAQLSATFSTMPPNKKSNVSHEEMGNPEILQLEQDKSSLIIHYLIKRDSHVFVSCETNEPNEVPTMTFQVPLHSNKHIHI